MITVGLDMSLTSTGFCLLNDELCSAMTIKTKPSDFNKDLDRLKYIVDETFKNIPENVDLICVEDYFIPQSRMQFNAAISLISLGTLIRIKLYENKFPFVIIAPTQLKKWILGKGNGQKSLIIREVFKKLNLDVKDDNQADSAVLSYIAKDILIVLKKQQVSKDFTKQRLEVIETIINDRPRYNCQSFWL